MKYIKYFLIILVLLNGCEKRTITKLGNSKSNLIKENNGIGLLKESNRIDKQFIRYNKTDSTGYGLLILKDNEPVHLAGYGMADIENEQFLGSDTRFISSLYYDLTAILVLKMAEDSIFSLNEPVINYLPELSGIYDSTLTLELLLKGMSGLPVFNDKSKEKNQWTINDIFDLYTKWDSPQYQPGEGVSYNLEPICALFDKIIYRKTGKSLEEHFQDSIFSPLEMHNTGFLKDGEDDDLKCYKRRSTGLIPIEKPQPLIKKYNEIVTTLEDIAKLYKALDGGNLLNKESMDYYYEPFKNHEGKDIIDELNPHSSYYTGYYCLAGYITISRSSGKVLFYSGTQKAGGIFLPNENLRVFMFTNVSDGDVFNVGYFRVLEFLKVL